MDIAWTIRSRRAGDQPDAIAIALNSEAVAIIFHLVDPLRPGRTWAPMVGMQNSKVLHMNRR